jgi:hypothetical protein
VHYTSNAGEHCGQNRLMQLHFYYYYLDNALIAKMLETNSIQNDSSEFAIIDDVVSFVLNTDTILIM